MGLVWVKCTLCRRYIDVPPEWKGTDPSGRAGAQVALNVHRKRCSLSKKAPSALARITT